MKPSRPLGPRSNWITAPLSSRPYVQLHCPHRRDGGMCGHGLLGRIRFPPAIHAYPVALRTEADETGRGFVKPCPKCGGLVEIVMQRAAA
jgi:hypothetical protein